MIADALKKTLVLIRREVWESPFAFKWTPLMIFGFLVLTTVLALIVGAKVDNQMSFTLDGIRMWAQTDVEQKRLLITGGMFSIGILFHQIMFLVVVFYLAGSLYDDRKDRSILFWKSLPVSDHQTVVSKLLTAMVAAPLLFLVGIALTHLLMLIIATFYAMAAGINPLTEIWVPANPISVWLIMLLGSLVQSLWLLPIYAWLMFCSSWAPRLPILIAFIVPALIGLFQHFWSLLTSMRLPGMNLFVIIGERIGRGVLPSSIDWEMIKEQGNATTYAPIADQLIGLVSILRALASAEMWIGVVIGLILLAGAIWFRRRATDT